MLGRLCIRYFPSLQDEVFHGLSVQEQVVRSSDLLRLHRNPNVCGAASQSTRRSLLSGPSKSRGIRGKLQFVLRAPEWWVSRHTEGLWVEEPSGGRIEVVPIGEKGRNLPAWQLAWSFLDWFLSCVCFIYKAARSALRSLKKREGVVCDLGASPDGSVRETQEPSARVLALGYPFPRAVKTSSIFAARTASCLGWRVRDFRPRDSSAVQRGIPENEPAWINRKWWNAATVDVSLEDLSPG